MRVSPLVNEAKQLTVLLLLIICPLVTSGDDKCEGGSCPSDSQPINTSATRALVSVVTPTRKETQRWHELLYECFSHQTYPNKELLVLDTSPRPSKFFKALNDSRVTYIFHKGSNMSLGQKRNFLGQKANGTFLAHFDDDDWYSPQYLDTMVSAIKKKKAAVVKLSGWFVYSCKIHYFGYFDPGETAVFGEVKDPQHGGLKYSLFLDPRDPIVQTWVMGPSDSYDKNLRDETRYGFGFSYVYRKKTLEKNPFNASKTFGEDLEWISKLLRVCAPHP